MVLLSFNFFLLCTLTFATVTQLTFALHLSFSGGISYTHPHCVTSWVDDVKHWPEVSVANIICYLVRSKACDLKEAEAYKSLASYNYL